MNDEQKSSPTSSNIKEPQKPCVLLVEDDRSVRRYLEVTLQRAGFEVIPAEDGVQGMKLAMSSRIDAVVTDAVMPHLSGQQLANSLRTNPKLARIPVILLTGQENKEATANESIDAFLLKPVKADELASCLAKLLQKAHST